MKYGTLDSDTMPMHACMHAGRHKSHLGIAVDLVSTVCCRWSTKSLGSLRVLERANKLVDQSVLSSEHRNGSGHASRDCRGSGRA
jgi:hypothetical protein